MSNRSQITAGFVKTVPCTYKIYIQKHNFIHSHYPHFPRLYVRHFLSLNTICLQLTRFHSFNPICNGGLKLLRKASKDHTGFVDHLGICFKIPATQFTFQWWK